MIPWWCTSFGEEEIEHVVQSMRNKCTGQVRVIKEFEKGIFHGVVIIPLSNSNIIREG